MQQQAFTPQPDRRAESHWPEAVLRTLALAAAAGSIYFLVQVWDWYAHGEGMYKPQEGAWIALLMTLVVCVVMARQMALRRWACATGATVSLLIAALVLLAALETGERPALGTALACGVVAIFMITACQAAWPRLRSGF